jgi:hypothetical protein
MGCRRRYEVLAAARLVFVTARCGHVMKGDWIVFSKVIRCISSARKAPAVLIVALTLITTGCSRQEIDYRAADVQLAQTVRTQLDASADTKGAASRVVVEAKD